jgi:hypothetical protein
VSTQQIVQFGFLRKPQAYGFLPASVLVRSFAALHNYHYRMTVGTGTDVSVGRGERIDPLLLIRCNDKVERPVEPALWGAQPFYPDVDSAPFRFDQLLVPFADWLQVDGPSVAEVQPRPQHPSILGSRINA